MIESTFDFDEHLMMFLEKIVIFVILEMNQELPAIICNLKQTKLASS